MFKYILLLIAGLPLSAHADINTDRSAGNCIAYLALQKKTDGMKAALSMADKEDRALSFADSWLKQAARYKNDKAVIQGMVGAADGDCRKVGIRPGDY